MNSRSSRELEREAERHRSELEDTVENLRDRFSPAAAVEYMRGPGGKRLLRAVQENPLAAALAMAGIGWLLYTALRLQGEDERSGSASRAGVMGDETQEQNLNQAGHPEARITQQEVQEAFGQGGGSGSKKR